MRSFAPLILAALASSASAQSFDASAGQSAPTDLPEFSGRPSGFPTGSAAFPQGTGGFGGHGQHSHASGSGGFARPSGQNDLGFQQSGFPSHTGSDFAFPTGTRPFESGSPQSARRFAREFPSGGNFESGSFPSGPQQTGERPTGAFPSGFPSGGNGGAFATGSRGARPSGVGTGFESRFGGERPTGARPSGMPSGSPPSFSVEPTLAARQEAPTGTESGFGGEKPTGAIPSGARPSGGAFPSGSRPSGARPSGNAFPSGKGKNGARPSGKPSGSGAPPAISGAPTDIVARQAPTGIESEFGGSKPTGAFPTGLPSGFPSGAFPTDGSFPTGAKPTGAFKSGSAFPSGGANFFQGNKAAQSGLPTIPIPSGGLPLIPTGGMAAPSGGFPTTFQTRVRPTTAA